MVLNDFYKHICKNNNFIYLSRKNFLYPKTSEIVWRFIEENIDNYKYMKEYFQKYANVVEYVYSKVYPDVYPSTEYRDINLKSEFQVLFQRWDSKKNK